MPAGISRPDVWTGLALNRDPNDPNTPPVWTPVESSRLQLEMVSEQQRGRDYELAQSMAGSPRLVIRDVNEDLNPDNPSSPYAGQVDCYREVCMLSQWPITATGGNNNLLNLGTWRGSKVDPYDPTFESYTVGDVAPNWLTRLSLLADPVIANTNPFQGTKHVQYGVGAFGSGQGIRFGVPVIPGRQYTTSAYVRQTAGNTLGILADGITAVYDPFNRTASGGLGAPNASWNGAGYVLTAPSSSDFSVSAGQARISNASVGVARFATIGSFVDSEQTITVTAPVLAAGASYFEGLTARFVDDGTNYRALLEFTTTGSVRLVVERRVAFAPTSLASVDLPLAYSPGDRFTLHFSARGAALGAWCWPESRPESRRYDSGPIVDTTLALQGPGGIGFLSYSAAGSTNGTFASPFARYGATGSVLGGTTVTSGAYVRLAVTYTADQVGRPAGIDPILNGNNNGRGLCVKIVTMGVPGAATVSVDAIQHEQGAAASAFSATGPVIYPGLRHNVERFTRGWRARGFEGVTSAPSVDALAQLSKIRVSTEYVQQVMALQPDLYYPLDGDGANATAADMSGNAGPPLVPIRSPLGSGTPIQGGTDMGMPGDPGGAGSTFTWVGPADSAKQQGTILGAGPGTDNPAPLAFPVLANGKWAVTVAMWVVLATNAETSPSLMTITRYASPSLEYRPIRLNTATVSMRNGLAAPGTVNPLPTRDGLLHFVVGQVEQDATNTTLTFRRDGTEDSVTVSTAGVAGGMLPAGRANTISVGGVFSQLVSGIANTVQGAIAHVAVWNRALSFGERDTLWNAGTMAAMNASGELPGTRTLRHLAAGGYTGPTRISAGTSLLGAPTYSGSIDLMTDTLSSAQADGGVAWAQPDGVIAMEGRADRWSRLASRYTFGEDETGGEIPYEQQPVLDRDPTYVFPVVTWKRASGMTAVGGLPSDRLAAARRYYPRQFDGASDFLRDSQTQDAADWTFYSHRAPLTRCDVLVLNPWATPSLWPACLSLEPGMRVRLLRRAKAANGGAGLVLSYDFFVEKVSIPEMVFREGQERWTYEVQLSPIGVTGAPTPMQPWILGDGTWGALDSTTVLGW